nr:efflux RND transporter permease subunit [Sphingomonas sp.]
VLATTMAIVAVFLPVALMPGISGQFFRNFGYTVVLAVLMSLLVARMITPLMAAYFLRAHGEQAHAEGPTMAKYLRLLRWSLDTASWQARRARIADVPARIWYLAVPFGLAAVGGLMAVIQAVNASPETPPGVGMMLFTFVGITIVGGLVLCALAILIGLLVSLVAGTGDGGFLAWSRHVAQRGWARLFDHRMVMVGASIGALVLTVVAFMTLSLTFQPEQDEDTSRVRIGMPPGTTLAQTRLVAGQAAEIIAQHPDVDKVFERIFTSAGFVNVKYKDDREKKSFEIERELNPKLAQIADAQVNFLSQGGGGPGGGGRAITLFLGGDDPVLLDKVAQQVLADMETLPEVVAPRVQGDNVRPEILVTPRFDLAAELGVTTAALSQTIRIATIGDIDQNSAKFSLSDRQVPIIVSLPKSARADLSVLENLPVPTANGGSVPLKAVAEIGFGSGPVTVQRTNQVRRIAIGADLAPGLVSGDAWKKINQLPSVTNMPEGVSRLTLGDQKWQDELIESFILAVLAGILLVFAVLVLLYRRFLAPFVNMGSLLLAPLGAGIALHLAGMPISMPVFIGLLMLLGIVAKNSILLVDFAVEMMDHGMPKNEAIAEAGHKRAQPIVMTTVAMVAGMIPTAMSFHGDGSWRAPMGVTVIGGLIFSTALTLLFVPAFFSLAIDVEKWVARKFGGLLESDSSPTSAEPLPAE